MVGCVVTSLYCAGVYGRVCCNVTVSLSGDRGIPGQTADSERDLQLVPGNVRLLPPERRHVEGRTLSIVTLQDPNLTHPDIRIQIRNQTRARANPRIQ